MSKQEMLKLIEKKRSELMEVVAKSGLNATITIQLSQELDLLLNQYNEYMKKAKRLLSH
ncbi:aspartyl-phosphate phosphatase Spo0E family protein [Anoxybacteroides amylolyticum]|uniref:Spo0E like sporulation regulatory family protein n=1 Tax=Anoxybacteroides amylolyticum TaxID=294699 RepID=A0A167TBA6_9BACL|nr:aspartyl-phosphate phosphatase Spo0E family protein [Anoxybacillus amylolyticus]ANB59874.1 spo0E like sporulation regulatory family protein [Anoxybacillus amylolyticus]